MVRTAVRTIFYPAFASSPTRSSSLLTPC
jgi:hypothetical protein